MSSIPADDPLRIELNDEVHARPSEVLSAPSTLTYLALRPEPTGREQEWQCMLTLANQFGVPPPARNANHFSADFGAFRLKWERHSEFTRYMFIGAGLSESPFDGAATAAVPPEWIQSLPGTLIVATNIALLSKPERSIDTDEIAARHFGGNVLIGSSIGGGAALALTDFRIRPDRFSRLLVVDREMTPRQTGRMVQRLVEIDTYRIMALLALPVARELAPYLSESERNLTDITSAIAGAQEKDEPLLLAQLTRLEAEINNRESKNHFRFSAAIAYHKLVQRRISDLREERIAGIQTFQEFMERRLAPAMDTCLATANRQRALSDRVARTTQLLSTRVDITREQQTHAVLKSMNRRAHVQLRLQETVEGLSVAAVTYYVCGLISYAGKGLKAVGIGVNPDALVAISIPLVALAVLLGVRQIRRTIAKSAG